MKLGLGTVQFGMDYGLSNVNGKPTEVNVEKIINFAAEKGINILDTASLYGNSEATLGKVLKKYHSFNIVTKTPVFNSLNIKDTHIHQLQEAFLQSLKKMKQEKIYGLLLHRSEDLFALNGERLIDSMRSLKKQRLVNKIGVSVYTEKELKKVLKIFTPDIIQLPLNVYDQRFLRNGLISLLKKKGVEIHVRSVFLQGLLLMNEENRPEYFDVIKEHFKKYKKFMKEHELSAVKSALLFVSNIKEVDAIIVGVNHFIELSEIFKEMSTFPDAAPDYSVFSIDDQKIINPSLWELAVK